MEEKKKSWGFYVLAFLAYAGIFIGATLLTMFLIEVGAWWVFILNLCIMGVLMFVAFSVMEAMEPRFNRGFHICVGLGSAIYLTNVLINSLMVGTRSIPLTIISFACGIVCVLIAGFTKDKDDTELTKANVVAITITVVLAIVYTIFNVLPWIIMG